MKKAKAVRKTLKEKLAEVHLAGVAQGRIEGANEKAREFKPDWYQQKNLTDFVRMIESWGNMTDDGVIMIAGTDLKNHCNAAIPLRLLRKIGEELNRLGYKTGR